MTAYAYCPTLGLACTTAALKKGCRCDVCGPWYARYNEERRGGRPAKVVHAASPRCPVHGVQASTAYRKLKCRCETCRSWNRGRERRRTAMNTLRPELAKWLEGLREDPQGGVEVASKMMAAYRRETESRAKAAERRKVKVRRRR